MMPPPTPAGILPVHKPPGPTSAQVLNWCKAAWKRSGLRLKLGHAGTLDPLASGLLLALVGPATRWFDPLSALLKQYHATIRLDALSDTDDAEGPLHPLTDPQPPDLADLHAALARWSGWVLQAPPARSRVHINGTRSDGLARAAAAAGTVLQRPAPRSVYIRQCALLAYQWPQITIHVTCGSGTYIRSLARDLGTALGLGGYLTALQRTAIGSLTLDDAVPIDAQARVCPTDAALWLSRLLPLEPLLQHSGEQGLFTPTER